MTTFTQHSVLSSEGMPVMQSAIFKAPCGERFSYVDEQGYYVKPLFRKEKAVAFKREH